jgi:hypothetical protein
MLNKLCAVEPAAFVDSLVQGVRLSESRRDEGHRLWRTFHERSADGVGTLWNCANGTHGGRYSFQADRRRAVVAGRQGRHGEEYRESIPRGAVSSGQTSSPPATCTALDPSQDTRPQPGHSTPARTLDGGGCNRGAQHEAQPTALGCHPVSRRPPARPPPAAEAA